MHLKRGPLQVAEWADPQAAIVLVVVGPDGVVRARAHLGLRGRDPWRGGAQGAKAVPGPLPKFFPELAGAGSDVPETGRVRRPRGGPS